jgi:hypothetical protein
MLMTERGCRSSSASRTPARGQGRRRPIALKKNEAFLKSAMFTRTIDHKKPPRRPCPAHIAHANPERSAVRSAVEHVFARQKHRIGLFIRTIGVARARRSGWRASPIIPAPRLAREERCVRIARKRGAQRRSSPEKPKETSPKWPAFTHTMPRSDPSRSLQAKNSRFFEVS